MADIKLQAISSDASDAADEAKFTALVHLLCGAVPRDMPHHVTLDALLSVYCAVAEFDPRYTGEAARAALSAHAYLHKKALAAASTAANVQ